MELSDTARLLVRPFRTYEELAAAAPAPGRALAGAARLLLVLATLVAVTSTGRFAPVELVTAVPSFAYVLGVQAIAIAMVVRLLAPQRVRVLDAYGLYLAGHGPWLLVLLAICVECIVLELPGGTLLSVGPWLFLGAFVWGGFLTYACFRAGLGMPRFRAWVAMGLFYVVTTTSVLGYFVVAGQLLPILPSAR